MDMNSHNLTTKDLLWFRHEPNALGTFISDKREQLNMTANALADKSDISRNEIVRIETGQRKQPSLNNLRKIASVLGIRYDILLVLAGYIPHDEFGGEMDVFFHYPGLTSEAQIQTVEEIVRLLSLHPELTADDLNDVIKHLNLLIVARQMQTKE